MKVLGRYNYASGYGESSAVAHGYNDLGERIVIKNKGKGEEVHKQILKEFEIMVNCKHENVLDVIDMGLDKDGNYYMVKLGDFSCARRLCNNPPETTLKVGTAVDIWSAGILLVGMLLPLEMPELPEKEAKGEVLETIKKFLRALDDLIKDKDALELIKSMLASDPITARQALAFSGGALLTIPGSFPNHSFSRAMADYVWVSGARLLGAGADGEVRVGFHRKTGDKVAMKKMYEHEYLYDAIINESEILEEVAHDNVVNLFGLTCNNQGTFMVMELMDGSLSDVISSRKLGEHDIRAVMRQILEGLAWIHAHRIVHQDVKTSNVLVKRDGEKNKFVVKLADFATARAADTPLGATSFGTAIDVWGARCIFAEMLLGSNPFDVPDEEDGDSLDYFVADFAKKLDIDGCGMGYQDRRRERARERILEKMVWWKAEDVRSGIKDPDAVELLKRMLAIDPARRISAQNALKMPYFQEKADDTARPVLPTMTTASGNFRPAWVKINNAAPSIATM
ncbi:hypothetical protein SELMODRAFT_404153 [Selaginella moellendorffii]|uniref:Protein kinase domain-containing protein n=1 Tax=Selaginella moellendorffii TaxID=88036 RepID=D8QUF7_SELML|nr:hypothetical protein SELMODRAFT_404153 [Selaginella moellendorffii]